MISFYGGRKGDSFTISGTYSYTEYDGLIEDGAYQAMIEDFKKGSEARINYGEYALLYHPTAIEHGDVYKRLYPEGAEKIGNFSGPIGEQAFKILGVFSSSEYTGRAPEELPGIPTGENRDFTGWMIIDDEDGFLRAFDYREEKWVKVGLKPGRTTEEGGEIFNDYIHNKASDDYTHAEGEKTTAFREAAHAEGKGTIATGLASHAEGLNEGLAGAGAHGEGAHAEGINTTAVGDGSHAEGLATQAIKESSHAEGTGTKSTNSAAHAEGESTTASGPSSHAEGYKTTAEGESSHAGGISSIATHKGSFVHGLGLNTGAINQTVIGMYNNPSENSLFVIGNGSSQTKSNILEVRNDKVKLSGNLEVGGFGSGIVDTNTLRTGTLQSPPNSYITLDSDLRLGEGKIALSNGTTLIKYYIYETVSFTVPANTSKSYAFSIPNVDPNDICFVGGYSYRQTSGYASSNYAITEMICENVNGSWQLKFDIRNLNSSLEHATIVRAVILAFSPKIISVAKL